MPRITISYRRDDSLDITGRIFDRLAAHFGRESVFRDIDNIPPGADFRRHIDQVLDESDIILAIVGPRWIGPRVNQSRLASAADPVRLEIETALRKEKPLIPVLVSRAPMPRPEQLPDGLQDFAYRNALQVDSSQNFETDVSRLIRAMEAIVKEGGGTTPSATLSTASAVIDAGPEDSDSDPANMPKLATTVPVRGDDGGQGFVTVAVEGARLTPKYVVTPPMGDGPNGPVERWIPRVPVLDGKQIREPKHTEVFNVTLDNVGVTNVVKMTGRSSIFRSRGIFFPASGMRQTHAISDYISSPSLAAEIETLRESNRALEQQVVTLTDARDERARQAATLREEITRALLGKEEELKELAEQLATARHGGTSRAGEAADLEDQIKSRDAQIEKLSHDLAAARRLTVPKGLFAYRVSVAVLGVLLAVSLGWLTQVSERPADDQVARREAMSGNFDAARATVNQPAVQSLPAPPIKPVPFSTAIGIDIVMNNNRPVVAYVENGSPASKAGIQLGDVISLVDNSPISDASEFVTRLSKVQSGQIVHLTLKNGQGSVRVVAFVKS